MLLPFLKSIENGRKKICMDHIPGKELAQSDLTQYPLSTVALASLSECPCSISENMEFS